MADGSIEAFGLAYIVAHIGADGAEQVTDVSMLLLTLGDGTGDSTARAACKHQQQFHAQMLDGIVHTTHHHRSIDVVACRADDKDVAYALIEKQLDRHA